MAKPETRSPKEIRMTNDEARQSIRQSDFVIHLDLLFRVSSLPAPSAPPRLTRAAGLIQSPARGLVAQLVRARP